MSNSHPHRPYQYKFKVAGWGFNSLAPASFGSNFKSVINRHILQIKFMSTSCGIVFNWKPQNPFGNKSTLVLIMAWCCQAQSHYLSQCWPISMSTYALLMSKWFTKQQHSPGGKSDINPDSKVHGANKGPNWVLSARDGPNVGPMNLAIRLRKWLTKPSPHCINYHQNVIQMCKCLFVKHFDEHLWKFRHQVV